MAKPNDKPGVQRLRAMNAGPRPALDRAVVWERAARKIAEERKPRPARRVSPAQVELI